MVAQAITAAWRLHAELLIVTLCTAGVVLQLRKEKINKKWSFIVQENSYRIRSALSPLHVVWVGSTGAVELQSELRCSGVGVLGVYVAVTHLIKLAIFCNLLLVRNIKFSSCWNSTVLRNIQDVRNPLTLCSRASNVRFSHVTHRGPIPVEYG
jgi:hypothetical protein